MLLLAACTSGPPPQVTREPDWVKATPATQSRQWRCRGEGASRQCRRRARDASPFVCVRGECTQLWPRLPDVNEWDCQSGEGPVLCLFHAKAAGLADLGPGDTGYACGPRRNQAAGTVCLDTDPDLPELAGHWSCRFDSSLHGAKRCVALPAATPSTPVAVAGVPNCWLDDDCAPSRCVLGRCAEP